MGAFFARLFGRGDDRKASRITEQDRAIFVRFIRMPHTFVDPFLRRN